MEKTGPQFRLPSKTLHDRRHKARLLTPAADIRLKRLMTG
jgi:hypothetical protein